MRGLLLVAVLLGCTSPTASSTTTTGGEATDREDPVDRAERDPVEHDEPDVGRAPGACPAAFGELGPSCEGADVPVGCHYPEGDCLCLEPLWCGGAAPPPMPRTWQCVRPPTPCPTAGTPCRAGEPACMLDGCGFLSVSCEGGVWVQQMGPLPP